ncbi:NAD-P-binding protein [Lentinus tigrinus ALCF2SS1-7]|uniref:NAD-P-binding protein n=1 Tax=Lentinus tigrinus ALCF2SS1-6 TaxID=1328759 RepID=A0A5C2S799_9APHY|nr:NAD-P-binding protein [Lentinus tigrinus ALCF2SS1-6]RPD73514.1 NAD-P-binding protein [Lentinus tigrinus ALCF2SS1-7]
MASSSPQSNPPRIAIVTGAAQGIGEAIALRLADDGLDVAVADLPSKRVQLEGVASAIEAKGRRALVLVGDITVEEDVAAVVAKTVEELGGLDVMVANAGVFVSIPFVDMTVEELNRVLRVNVCGSMLCFQHAARQMIQQGRGGRIIGASSLGGKRGFPSATAYVASKFAVRGLAQCVATELWEHNITVNTYAPGVAATPMTSHPDDAKNGGTAATLFKNTGMPIDTKLVPVSEVAELVAYLAKPETSSVTGQCFSINNGLHMD